MGRKPIDLTGQRFGRLTVVKRSGSTPQKLALWLCKCDCGNEKIIDGHTLRRGGSKSCGCYRTERESERAVKRNYKHGQRKTRLYGIWLGMKSRCYNSNDHNFLHYGAKGIEVCEEWTQDFQSFYGWSMSHGYKEDLSIDRIDVNGNYEPNNCRWVTMKVQQNNRSNNHLITCSGETHTISEWAEITGMNKGTIRSRLVRGWSEEKTISCSVKEKIQK